jgi:hypothetical protein
MELNKKKKSKWYSKDVAWYSKKYKRPIAYSTVATSDFISLINQPNKTAKELYNYLTNENLVIRDNEAISIMKAFMNKGLDDEIIIIKLW